jgi:hypothetical protein
LHWEDGLLRAVALGCGDFRLLRDGSGSKKRQQQNRQANNDQQGLALHVEFLLNVNLL